MGKNINSKSGIILHNTYYILWFPWNSIQIAFLLHLVTKEHRLPYSQIWPRGYSTFCVLLSMSMKPILLINVKMPKIIGILTG